MKPNHPRSRLRREWSGFTLIELAIVIVVLAVVLGSVWGALLSAEVFSGNYARELVVNQTGGRILDRLEEIQGAHPATVNPLVMVDSDWIVFQTVIRYEEGGTVLSDAITIAYRVETGEALNGVDDNGDGRIDEGVIEYTAGNPPVTVQIARDVLGLRFNPTTKGVECAVDVGVVDREGNLLSRTFTEKVTFRN